MSQIKAMGNKFKRVEVAMQKTLLACSTVTEELGKALNGNHSKNDLLLLQNIKESWIVVHKEAGAIAQKLVSM